MADFDTFQTPSSNETVERQAVQRKPGRTAQDWVRDMRMSADVNRTTVGVETDRVTPELLLATSNKLLAINRREVELDAKDSLEFQRIYGAGDYFAEHVLKDANRLGRQLLWKATNKGSLDFMPVAALDAHVSDVFNKSKLANMVDSSSPMESVDASYKITRLGEGGVGDISSAPDEMRLVQPSFFGYIGPVRSVDSIRVGLDAFMTKNVMKGSDGKLYQTFINAHTGKPELVDSVTAAKSVVTTPEMMNMDTDNIYALGGKTGVRIVKKSDVDYYLPGMDDAFSTSANLVTGMSGVKEMRMHMGCLHPATGVLVVDQNRLVSIVPAKDVCSRHRIPGATADGSEQRLHDVRTSVAKFPGGRAWFKKVVLYSGRTLITSRDHRWSVIDKDGGMKLVTAEKLKRGDRILRTLFQTVPARRTFVNTTVVTKDVAVLLGYAVRGMELTTQDKIRIPYQERHESVVEKALDRLGETGNYTKYSFNGVLCVGLSKGRLHDFLLANVFEKRQDRRVPSCILSATLDIVTSFLDAYTADETRSAVDSMEYSWILDLPNLYVREAIAFLLARTGTDTYYRDAYLGKDKPTQLALKLVDAKQTSSGCVVDMVKSVLPAPYAPVMVDIDVDDSLYAVANGVITHNSKYPLQAVSIDNREAPLVRGMDSSTGKDMHSLIGRYLGARYASKPGYVSAVRKDRIDMLYDDGTKGSVALYRNFPMNTKGYLDNTPQVKAGMHVDKGSLLASSNYTDKDGVAAIGTNLRTGWISWHGGTYEDAIVISESAAKKLSSTTMYPTTLDLDKTVKLGKRNYQAWKPEEYTNEQLDQLDDDGVVKPGAIIRKGDPVVLAIRTSEPSPGTMGKRLLTDVSETWEHEHPGEVTDVIKTRSGVKVLTKVTTPCEVGDKLSGCYDDETEIFTERGFVLFKDLLPDDRIAVLHDDGTASFDLPLDYQAYPYKGCMVEYNTKRMNFKVTPDHNMAFVPRYEYETGSRSLAKAKAADVYGKRIFMRTSACFDAVLPKNEQDVVSIPEYEGTCRSDQYSERRMAHVFKRADLAAFLGIYLAEGHCAKKSGQRWIRISQYDTADGGKERCAAISSLLDRMGLEWHYYDHKYFMISNWALHAYVAGFGDSYGKHVPDDVFLSWPKEDIETLLKWFYMGDGERMLADGASARCATVSKRLADDLQRLYILTGKYSCVHHTRAANARSGIVYKVSSSDMEFIGVGNGKHVWTTDDAYDGMVYCVTSTTGIILVRRHGVPVWNAQCYGNKGVVGRILPDNQMPVDKDGKPLEFLFSPLSLVSRTNASMLHEAVLGKVAHKTGKFEFLPQFYDGNIKDYVEQRCKEAHVHPDDDFFDPETGRRIPDVVNGYSYIYRLKHMAEGKMSERGTGGYSTDDTPSGSNESKSKRFGTLEVGAMVSHAAFDNLLDAKLIRGQSNADFWREIRTGGIPTIPGEPLVHKKFFAHLQGSGINVRKTPKGISIFALSNSDVSELAGPRELKSRDTYEARTFAPINGGLFGKDIFGDNGDKWAYIKLDEPVPNPVMEDPLARLLRMSAKDFTAVVSGTKTVDGMSSATDMYDRLAKIDIREEAKQAMKEFKDAPASKKDAALKRYVAVERMNRAGVNPSEYMLDKIPVLPPVFRPISSHGGLTMVADANYLYAQLLDARDDMRDAKGLPDEYMQKARANVYRTWKELTGLYDPEDVKLRNKNVGGLLQWALGSGSPKFSAAQRKIIGTSVDTVGRGVVVPDAKLNIDQIGLPVKMAMGIMSPFVERKLVTQGYTPVAAMKLVKKQAPQAMSALDEVMKTHPVLINRAPTLHKFNIMAQLPVLVQGNAIHVHPSICPGEAMDFDGDDQIGRIKVLVSSELFKNEKILENLPESELQKIMTVLHYVAGTNPGAVTTGDVNMSFHQLKVQILSAAINDKVQTVLDMDLADIPHGRLVAKDAGENHSTDFYEALPGIKVLAYSEATGRLEWADVAYWSEHHDRPVEIVHLDNGCDIITDDDPRAVYGIAKDADSLQPKRFTPSQALELGVVVPCQKPGISVIDEDRCPRYIREDGVLSTEEFAGCKCYELTFELGQVLGILAGDGWWDKVDRSYLDKFGNGERGVYLADNEGFNASYIEKFFTENVDDELRVFRHEFKKDEYAGRYGDTVRYSFLGGKITAFCRMLCGMLGGESDDATAGSANKHLPIWFQAAPYEFRRGLLCGLVATDGSVSVSHAKRLPQLMIGFCSTSLRLCRELKDLCRTLGIRSSITFSKTTSRGNSAWQVTVGTVDTKGRNALAGMAHERKLDVFNSTAVDMSARRSQGDYRPFPKCVVDAVRRWLHSPKAASEVKGGIPESELSYRSFVNSLSTTCRKYAAKGYITAYEASQLKLFAEKENERRAEALDYVKVSVVELEKDEHIALDELWKQTMWKSLDILADQLPHDVYREARGIVSRRVKFGTGCKGLTDALKRVLDCNVKSNYGLSEDRMFQEWLALALDGDCCWTFIKDVEKTGKTETGYDLTVPGYETFTSSSGVVLSNTVNIHVPVSDNARREAMDRMRPSRNFIAPADRKIINRPEKEYIQGLYIATRMGKAPDGRAQIFRTLDEARAAYKNGTIDIDTPIQILQQ